MKDNFSAQANQYAMFRPTYPVELYEFLLSHLTKRQTAWDCATGNGQVARVLSKYFNKVYATDISQKQIDHAVKKDNIFYGVEPAEQTSFADNYFDLITVAQAIHWFDFENFYKEVRRTLRPAGLLAVFAYGLIQIDNKKVNEIIQRFYYEITGPYWDKERKYVDDSYATIPFPFYQIPSPNFEIMVKWSFEQIKGYLSTWSAVQNYCKATGRDPIDIIYEELKQNFSGEPSIRFPIFIKVGVMDPEL